jgi:hypothetical protein
MDIEDLQDDWDGEMEHINQKLFEKAVDLGISKDEYYHKYKFDIFNIKDMEYEKNHASRGHQHIEGHECKFCKENAYNKKNKVKDMAMVHMDVNPNILANQRKFGQKGVRYDATHLLNYGGVAQGEVKTADHAWKNTMYNDTYNNTDNKYNKPEPKKAPPPKKFDPNSE